MLYFNALVFQLGWFVCVLGNTTFVMAYTFAALLFHALFLIKKTSEWFAIFLIVIIGCSWDAMLVYLGILRFPEAYPPLLPLWLICLWVIFATTFNHCLAWFHQHLRLAAMAAAFFAPMSYWAGTELADASLAEPFVQSLAILAIGWAVIFPFGLFISKNLNQRTQLCLD